MADVAEVIEQLSMANFKKKKKIEIHDVFSLEIESSVFSKSDFRQNGHYFTNGWRRRAWNMMERKIWKNEKENKHTCGNRM